MPRRARIYIPGLPYHVVQRGNNREACFIEPDNYQFYLDLWRELSIHYHCRVHAYCLMTNHVHFLVTPESRTAISDTMKVVGSRYAAHINRRYGRTGTLWEGRHRSSLVHSERYLLTCMRYIELNPVRAGMVDRPEAWRWSSYGSNAYGHTGWLRRHEQYMALGASREDRCLAYRELFRAHLDGQEIHLIRRAIYYCQPVGDDRFRQQIERRYGVRLGQMRRGRPRKKHEE
jgi:putative transposase